MKQGILLTALLLVAGLTMAGPAGAGDRSVSVTAGARGGVAHASALQLGVTGSPEADEISVTLDGTQTQFVITSTRPINPPPPPCVQISTSQVHCPTSEFVSFSATLGDGKDTFTVGPSVTVPVSLTGGSGRDTLIGGSGSDTETGGLGRDRLIGGNGRDTLNGGKSGDVEIGGKGRDTLLGGKGGDTLRGGLGRDVLRGGSGNDRLRGGPGRDVEKQ
jgi:Ca2+-binding RTX toxin-like protein